MGRVKERIEAMTTILEDMGIKIISEDQIKELTDSFCLHLEMEAEMDNNSHVFYKRECAECEKLKRDISNQKKIIDVYHNSVCKRRNTEEVWIEGDDVKFRP